MTSPVNTDGIARASGIAWADWIRLLDDAGGASLDHRALVAAAVPHLGATDSPGWWAQSVAVAYEQRIERRAPGQRQDGSFEASASRTHGGTLDQTIEAWRDLIRDRDSISGAPFQGAPSETSTPAYRRWRVTLADGTRILAQASLRGDRGVLSVAWSGLTDITERDARRVALRELLAGL